MYVIWMYHTYMKEQFHKRTLQDVHDKMLQAIKFWMHTQKKTQIKVMEI